MLVKKSVDDSNNHRKLIDMKIFLRLYAYMSIFHGAAVVLKFYRNASFVNKISCIVFNGLNSNCLKAGIHKVIPIHLVLIYEWNFLSPF